MIKVYIAKILRLLARFQTFHSKNFSEFVYSKNSIRTENCLKKQLFQNSVVKKVAWIMKHHFDGILREIYKPSKKFFIKSPYPYL